MRAKIAKRLRKECLRRGAEIKKEYAVKEPGWKRKDCGVTVEVRCGEADFVCCARDYLQAYRRLLENIKWMDENPEWEVKRLVLL